MAELTLDPSTTTKTEAIAVAQRAMSLYERGRQKAKAIKQAAKPMIEQAAESAAVGVGGAVAGLVDASMPKIPKTNLRTDLVLGTAISAVSLAAADELYGRLLGGLGSGMVAFSLGDAARTWAKNTFAR